MKRQQQQRQHEEKQSHQEKQPSTTSRRAKKKKEKPSTKAVAKDNNKKKKKSKAVNDNVACRPFLLHPDPDHATFDQGFRNVVKLLQGRKNIAVLTGAGISVSCGIPDFRTAGSGLYSTLDIEELGLSCPEELFDWDFFHEDPRPFFKFARNLYFPTGSEERVRPSDSHKLLAALDSKNMLLRIYSQNIDGLEEVAGVTPKRICYAHGSLQWATCCKCKRKVSAKTIEPAVLQGIVARCQVEKTTTTTASQQQQESSSSAPAPTIATRMPSARVMNSRKRRRPGETTSTVAIGTEEDSAINGSVCGGVLKPGVTFFGEALHDNVRRCLEADRNKVDALIVIGTSLSVAPISKVIDYLPADIPRILINRTVVHPAPSTATSTSGTADDGTSSESDEEEEPDFRENYVFDAYLLGFCDDVTRALAKLLFAEEKTAQSKDKKQPEKKSVPSSANDDDNDGGSIQEGTLLSTVFASAAAAAAAGDEDDDESSREDPSFFVAEDWKSITVPAERVFLFPGAQAAACTVSTTSSSGGAAKDDDDSDLTYREIAHCDGCSRRIEGTIRKCETCFDYDLCSECFPTLSKTHADGKHSFVTERASAT